MIRAACAVVLASASSGCGLDYSAFSIESENVGAQSGTGGAGADGASGGAGASSNGGSAGGGGAPPPSGGGGAGGSPGGAGGAGGQGGSGGSVPVTCTDQYGQSPDFMLCAESATVCEFSTNNTSASCNTRCGVLGGECFEVWDNFVDTCTPNGSIFDCGTQGLLDVVCVCSLGCGSGPPCMGGETCNGGVCQ